MDNDSFQINPQTIINELQNRLNALQGENVVLSAMLTELRAGLEEAPEEVIEDGEEVRPASE